LSQEAERSGADVGIALPGSGDPVRRLGRRGKAAMAVFRAALAVTLAVLTTSGCASFAENCVDPTLVTTSGDPLSGDVAIHLWRPHGANDTLLAGQAVPEAVLSPDGGTVAFVRPEGDYSDTTGYPKSRVAIMSLESREVIPLSADLPDTIVDDLQWWADGSEIAFIRRERNAGQIVAVRVEDGEERTLLDLADGPGSFAWSADGRELLIPTSPSTLPDPPALPKGELRRYTVDTGYHVVVDTPHEFIGQLAWSPDGRFVAMAANIPATTRQRLFVLDLESGVSTPIDRRRGGPQSLTWSGDQLLYTYFVWTPDDRLYLMRWDSDTGRRREVDRPGRDRVLTRFGSISASRCG
jgi:hypothetical protein